MFAISSLNQMEHSPYNRRRIFPSLSDANFPQAEKSNIVIPASELGPHLAILLFDFIFWTKISGNLR